MAMHVDVDLSTDKSEDDEEQEEKLVPMPESGGIAALRKKLHDRMAQLRNKGRPTSASGEAGDRDALLEERRRQRAAMRERRRKETKEKIKREEEMKGKKGKDKREERQKGNATKARYQILLSAAPELTTILIADTTPRTGPHKTSLPTNWASI